MGIFLLAETGNFCSCKGGKDKRLEFLERIWHLCCATVHLCSEIDFGFLCQPFTFYIVGIIIIYYAEIVKIQWKYFVANKRLMIMIDNCLKMSVCQSLKNVSIAFVKTNISLRMVKHRTCSGFGVLVCINMYVRIDH